jgi:hypothetical protein
MAIKAIGVELEGMWNTRPDGATGDPSVSGFVRETGREYTGEVPSPILALSEVESWMSANYPDAVNSTCGMHIHISFDTKTEYSLLMSYAERLQNDLIQNVREWATEREIIRGHPLWEELQGGNRFTRMGTENVIAQTRARGKSGVRYRMLNFCYSLHGTLEIRMLPGFKKKHLGIQAVGVVIDTVKRALDTYTGIPREITRETPVGQITCNAWKQGFTCSLDTSAQLKREIYAKLYGRYAERSMLARLLKRDRVTIPVLTLDSLMEQLTGASDTLSRFQVILTQNPERS